jgi:hypothetical protein
VAITRDNILGTNSNNGVAIVAITTGATATAGSRICVVVSWFATAGTMTVSDGTAYTKHVQVDNGSDHIAIFSRVLVGSLASGSAITATITGGASVGGVLLGAVSYLGTTGVDTTASPAGTSGSAWSSGSATNAIPDALFFGGAGGETATSTTSTPVNGSEVVDIWNSAAGQGLAVNETIASSIANRSVSGTWVGASSTSTTGALVVFSGTVIPILLTQDVPYTVGAGAAVDTREVTYSLTGTVSKNATNAVTGTGTVFLSELRAGDQIRIPGGTSSESRIVQSISSDTSLTTSVAFTTTASGQTGLRVDHRQVIQFGPARTATLANVTSAAADTVLLAANANRIGATVYNDSLQTLYLKYGSGASSTSWTVRLSSGGYWEMPLPIYTGQINGNWVAADGAARVMENVP